MNARERILRDNGLLALAAAVALAAAGNAAATSRPDPHNFPKPPAIAGGQHASHLSAQRSGLSR